MTLSLVLASFTSYAVSYNVAQEYLVSHPGILLPEISKLLLLHPALAWCFSVPWVCASSVLSFRKNIPVSTVCAFSASAMLSLVALSSLTVLACFLPYFQVVNIM